MSKNTTRISDLPDGINITIDENNGGGEGGFVQQQYSPLPPTPSFFQPQQQPQMPIMSVLHMQSMPGAAEPPRQQMSEDEQRRIQLHYENEQRKMQQQYENRLNEMQQQLAVMQQHRLPSRDIPMSTLDYMQDETTTANYIPKVELKEDFVRDKEVLNEEKLKKHEKSKKNKLDQIINEFQTPVFIMLLYFLFQTPFINNMIFKRFSFLSIIKEDGNFNMNGLICKSFLFSAIYYTCCKVVKWIVEI